MMIVKLLCCRDNLFIRGLAASQKRFSLPSTNMDLHSKLTIRLSFPNLLPYNLYLLALRSAYPFLASVAYVISVQDGITRSGF